MKEALKDIDSLDIDFVFKAIEDSLRIRFNNKELKTIKNLGELCDLTILKIKDENVATCTNQEAFYKIRNAFVETLKNSPEEITPKSKISIVLPRRNRIKNIKKIEKTIGYKLNLLKAPDWIIGPLIVSIFIGIIFLFINSMAGIILIVISIIGLELCKDYGKELIYITFRELTENSVLNNYSKSRKLKNSVNKNEIEKIVIGLFTTLLDFPKDELTRETTF